MIIFESNGDLVLELFYNLVNIAMDKFIQLMIPDLTPGRSNRTPPNEDEILSPTWYLNRSNSRRYHQRKSLHFDTIMEMSESQIDLEVSGVDSTQEENKPNSSFSQDLEDFKICMIRQGTVHSSPKLLTSHFEDSGFLNCSIEMTSRLETISEIESPQEEKSSGHDASFDFYIRREEENSNSWLKEEENSEPVANCDFIRESGVKNPQKYSSKCICHESSKPSSNNFIAKIMNDCDSADGIEIRLARNQPITDNVSEHDAIDNKFDDITSTN